MMQPGNDFRGVGAEMEAKLEAQRIREQDAVPHRRKVLPTGWHFLKELGARFLIWGGIVAGIAGITYLMRFLIGS